MKARVRLDVGWSLKFCKSVDEEAVRAARVPRRRSGSEESEAARGRFLKLTVVRGGAWVDFV